MSVTTALKARRVVVRDREAGFTLIELLVVVIIIGILAAIAIPVYIGVQNNAKDSAVKSDLVTNKGALLSYIGDHNGIVPTRAQAATVISSAAKYGWAQSSSTTSFDYATSGGGATMLWCITGFGVTGNVFSVTTNGAVAKGACPTDGSSW